MTLRQLSMWQTHMSVLEAEEQLTAINIMSVPYMGTEMLNGWIATLQTITGDRSAVEPTPDGSGRKNIYTYDDVERKPGDVRITADTPRRQIAGMDVITLDEFRADIGAPKANG